MFIVNAEITNDCNMDIRNEYTIVATEEEKDSFIERIKDDIKKWNYDTPGAVSFRNVSFEVWRKDNIQRASMSDFAHFTIGDFAKIFHYINKSE